MDPKHLSDPTLLKAFETAENTRAQALAMADFIDTHPQAGEVPDAVDAKQLAKMKKTLLAHLAILRGEHRRAVYLGRDTKSLTATARSEIDSLHLELQNLFYEQQHLRNEIAACENYPHKYTELSLIEVDEFLAKHPELIELNEHELTIARINDEHEQRRQLEKQRQELLKVKAILAKHHQEQKDDFEKLDKEIESWVTGHEKVLKLFDDRDTKESADTRAAGYIKDTREAIS